MFEPPAGSFHVGYLADGRAVATGAWRRTDVTALGGTSAVEVKRMYVAPVARGRGAARAMLAHLEASAAEAGADVVVLETGLAQPEAIGLYESSGYEPIPAFGYYRDAPLSRCYARLLRRPTTA
jgi:ribosomal protein S18 acetylase RimI-like enzyme